jgi:hypothetical protein
MQQQRRLIGQAPLKQVVVLVRVEFIVDVNS